MYTVFVKCAYLLLTSVGLITQPMSKKVVIIGGHGNVALRLTRLLTPTHSVTSIIRNPDQIPAIVAAGARPLLLSLEDGTVAEFKDALEGSDIVYFTAGAGGNKEDRVKKVDYEGALKVYDALEQIEGPKPRLISISAIDVRDPEKIPAHYTEDDIALSRRVRVFLAAYMKWKYAADLNLVGRTAFEWTILRPGGLTDQPGTGRASIGRTHMSPVVSRDDVAKTLALLMDREDASGLAIDIVGGDVKIEDVLNAMIEKGETDFPL